jgi:hypothetical protein
MKLKKIAKPEAVERLTVSVTESTLALLEGYMRYYTEQYGTPVERSRLVEELLKEFMTTDKAFMQWLKAPRNQSSASKTTTSADPTL